MHDEPRVVHLPKNMVIEVLYELPPYPDDNPFRIPGVTNLSRTAQWVLIGVDVRKEMIKQGETFPGFRAANVTTNLVMSGLHELEDAGFINIRWMEVQ